MIISVIFLGLVIFSHLFPTCIHVSPPCMSIHAESVSVTSVCHIHNALTKAPLAFCLASAALLRPGFQIMVRSASHADVPSYQSHHHSVSSLNTECVGRFLSYFLLILLFTYFILLSTMFRNAEFNYLKQKAIFILVCAMNVQDQLSKRMWSSYSLSLCVRPQVMKFSARGYEEQFTILHFKKISGLFVLTSYCTSQKVINWRSHRVETFCFFI